VTTPAVDDRTKARRELTVTVLLCAVGALVELLAVGRPWARVSSTTDTAAPAHVYAGTALASAVRPLALVALAGAAALLATKRWGRVAIGVLLVAAGVGAAVAAAVAKDPSAAGTLHHLLAWRIVAIIAALPVVAAGLAAAARGMRWSVMSARYDAPGAVRERAQDPDVELWEALDRGDDPTG
jgi:hypothetical protein